MTRVAIWYHYLQMGAPFRSEWHGRDGMGRFLGYVIVGLPAYPPCKQRFVLDVLVEVLYCVQNNMNYNGIARSQEQICEVGGKQVAVVKPSYPY